MLDLLHHVACCLLPLSSLPYLTELLPLPVVFGGARLDEEGVRYEGG